MTIKQPIGEVKIDWIKTVCWILIFIYGGLKAMLLGKGQPIPDWLDFTNPSPIGVVFTASVITLIFRNRSSKKRGFRDSLTSIYSYPPEFNTKEEYLEWKHKHDVHVDVDPND